jgi:hypothetical protein
LVGNTEGTQIQEYISIYKLDDVTLRVKGSALAGSKVFIDSPMASYSGVADITGSIEIDTPLEDGVFSVEIVDESSVRFLRGLADSTTLRGNYSGKFIYIQPQVDEILLVAVQDAAYFR